MGEPTAIFLFCERDSLFEEVATLTVESISVDEDVNKTIKAS